MLATQGQRAGSRMEIGTHDSLTSRNHTFNLYITEPPMEHALVTHRRIKAFGHLSGENSGFVTISLDDH